jgi:signal transduction histidine kinase
MLAPDALRLHIALTGPRYTWLVMDPAELLSLLIGSLQLALAFVVGLRLGRYGRAFPWLAALTVFFGLRGVMRIYASFAGDVPETLALPVDLLLLAVLLLLIIGVDRTGRGLRLAENEAHYREEEYRRALADYRRLARHRLANPLSVIRGGVIALKTLDLAPADRQELLDSIERESERLEHIALEPKPEGPEERDLRPRPHLRAVRDREAS